MKRHNQIGDENRIVDRRCHTRRILPYAFGTPEWVDAVQQAYAFWPRQDRRNQERRVVTRRTLERAVGEDTAKYRQLSMRRRIRRQQPETNMLSVEEIEMLQDLNNRTGLNK